MKYIALTFNADYTPDYSRWARPDFWCHGRTANIWFDLGRLSLDVTFQVRSVDLQLARRFRALVGIAVYAVACAVLLPLALLAMLGEAFVQGVEAFGSSVIRPILDALVPGRRYGLRSTFVALWRQAVGA